MANSKQANTVYVICCKNENYPAAFSPSQHNKSYNNI